jgi:hypothetical protein
MKRREPSIAKSHRAGLQARLSLVSETISGRKETPPFGEIRSARGWREGFFLAFLNIA